MKCNLRQVCLKNKGWTLYYLAHLLASYGYCASSTVYHWADGTRLPSSKSIDMLCYLLGCSLDDLFTTEPYKFENETLQEIAEKGTI